MTRQIVVDKSTRASIPALFNHPWMIHRRDSEVDFSGQMLLDLKAAAVSDGTRRPSLLNESPNLEAMYGKDRLANSPDVDSFFIASPDSQTGSAAAALPPLSPLNGNNLPDPYLTETTEADAANALIAEITTRGANTSNKGRGNVLGNIKRQKSKGMSPMLSGKPRLKKSFSHASSTVGSPSKSSKVTAKKTLRSGDIGVGGSLSGNPSDIQHLPSPPPSGTPKIQGEETRKIWEEANSEIRAEGVKSKKPAGLKM